ncbi:hypothetical protein NEUTE1DRAFT_117862 [Neurospora tetrasperma FGSC 2508]|uniref:Uncharacterized protein n=1 Tax=Neurospora tetrasperma (strain FGSC 2508 / ATCC MYA-4615 / P0657) TaxID=510951 RepID=F8MUJ9_NEUT8|nr:uncharacterized protein NEUTE1DRAFT_117862 [Neurospora tetrasperma FGSC 2508]EGO55681.1 hypothetical protein NEUTE1DRAFT_117862 [Neurospora tetrasperma FGSC 2508]EGZ69071.1 hypothetical protein NEUTE2DRAFT_145430 [Neurospora tetrasperma FGSC 2509]
MCCCYQIVSMSAVSRHRMAISAAPHSPYMVGISCVLAPSRFIQESSSSASPVRSRGRSTTPLFFNNKLPFRAETSYPQHHRVRYPEFLT